MPGSSLTFGRAASSDLRIGHVPEDLRVPRSVGRLECRPDGVLIHNLSDKRTLLVETFPGPGFEIPPLMLMGTMPHDLVTIVVRGEGGRRHTIRVDTTGLSASPRRPAAAATVDATVGYRRIPELSERQRELLCALCLPPSLGWNGRTSTPTYAEMEQILRERGVAVSAKRIRNALDDLRYVLAHEHGVADIQGESADRPAGGKQSFLPQLAQWARLSDNVTDDELDEFDRRAV
ncbi:hypothetical protein GCM10027261_04890 [Geodermatophilus arenarius]